MSEEQLNEQLLNDPAPIVEDELTVLKGLAAKLGVPHSPNIGVDALRKKINEAQAQTEEKPADKPAGVSANPNVSAAQARIAARKEALKLIRINVTCMNPNKKHLEGDVFTVSNSVIGTITKYIPFNTEDGWHVPNIILTVLKEKQFQTIVTKKLPNGQKTSTGKLIKEYNIGILDPLTEEELADLARRQAMSGSID